MYGEGGDDEATESAIELVGRCAEELGVGAEDVFVSVFRSFGCIPPYFRLQRGTAETRLGLSPPYPGSHSDEN